MSEVQQEGQRSWKRVNKGAVGAGVERERERETQDHA